MTARGTHKEEFRGIAPSGKQVTVTVFVIRRFVGGKVVEVWGNIDMFGMMQQLGVIPPPGDKK
jgi:predicted ester cyclase